MGIRVYQLARELGLTSKELVEKLKVLKVEVKGHMSTLDDETAEIVRGEIRAQLKAARIPPTPEGEKVLGELRVKIPLTVKELSVRLQTKPSELIKRLMRLNIFATINQLLDEESVKRIGKEFGYQIERLPTSEETLLSIHHQEQEPEKLVPKPPVVTLMGHVDHGKTLLLDGIRRTNVVEKEAGGITQHIGAYKVMLEKGIVTFLDTPGHEAFTAMRARGANVTDVVVLVVAADDGVMPQTIEAIDHARAAGVPIVVAINKCDLTNANPERARRQLSELDLTPEDWGGKTIMVNVSAKTGEGIDRLLEMLLLEADMLELKANPHRPARGIVIEAKLCKGKGPIATVLVQNGAMRVGDVIICGLYYGKIKAMIDDKGERVGEAWPSEPAEVLGLSGVPQAGDSFYVVGDEKKAKEISLARLQQGRQMGLGGVPRITLEELYQQIKEGKIKEFNLIIKADVQGSIGALVQSLEKLSTQEVRLKIIHSQVGNINESDIMLAVASNAVVIGFHVDVEPKAREASEAEKVDLRLYKVIYEVIEDIKKAMEGMLEPLVKELFEGRVEVRRIFRISRIGTVAGCFVTKGKIARSASARLIRDGTCLYEGKIGSLKRLKDDVREVKEGFECGITLSGSWSDVKEGDIIETFQIEEVERKL